MPCLQQIRDALGLSSFHACASPQPQALQSQIITISSPQFFSQLSINLAQSERETRIHMPPVFQILAISPFIHSC
jgi:hypothetical protein